MKILITFLIVLISITTKCQETEKHSGTYSITGTYEVIDGPMYGWKGQIDSTTNIVKSYGSQIALLNFLGVGEADSVMANVKQDSFYVVPRRIDYGDCTGYISGSGRFSEDSIYYSSIMGGCGIEGIIEFTCSGKRLTTNSTEITSSQIKINCFPNPFKDYITIEYPTSEAAVLEILSAHGKLVFKKEINDSGSTKINLSSLPAGLYLVKLKTSRKTLTEKMLKN